MTNLRRHWSELVIDRWHRRMDPSRNCRACDALAFVVREDRLVSEKEFTTCIDQFKFQASIVFGRAPTNRQANRKHAHIHMHNFVIAGTQH